MQHLHDAKGNCFAQVSMPSPHNKAQHDARLYEANAKLIAAAPDLLQALQYALDKENGKVGCVRGWQFVAREAIDKAIS
jgi:hypothetical protein